MKRFTLLMGLLLVAGLLAGYVAFGRPSLKSRAQAAYAAGDYPKAYTLYKQYAETPAVRANRAEQNGVLVVMTDIQQRMSVQHLAAVSAAPATASATMLDQALSYALQTSNGDPPYSAAQRIPHSKPAYGQMLAMSIKELGNFELDPNVDADVPADIHLLEGAHVKLHGYMVPLTQAVKVDKFALVPSLINCCTYEAQPGVQHIVTCSTPRDQAIDYVLDELEIDGILHVRVKREDGYTNSIFELDVTGAKIMDSDP